MTTRLESTQKGFTLIELMITLLLGALISAAVIQVFLTSQRVDRLQTSGSEIQEKSIFGMQFLEKQIRLANLGNDGVEINDLTAGGGVVMSSISEEDANNEKLEDAKRLANVITDTALKSGYLTRSSGMTTEGSDAWSGISSMTNTEGDIPSDQLTIQYTDVVDDMVMYDCEGTKIEKASASDEDVRVIERYYLKEETDNSINLRCDAGRIVKESSIVEVNEDGEEIVSDSDALTVIDFGDTTDNKTAIIMEDVDQFNIRLGVARRAIYSNEPVLEKKDMTVQKYMGLGEKPYITNIRLAVLARSSSNSPEASPDTFTIFGEEQKLKDTSKKYMRRLYETNVLLRNARVLDL